MSRSVRQSLQDHTVRETDSDNRFLRNHEASVISVDEERRPTKRLRLSPPAPPHLAQSTSTESTSSDLTSGLGYTTSQPVSFGRSPTTPLSSHRNLYQYHRLPPTSAELLNSTERFGVPSKIYHDPYYSKASDAPERPREYAGLVFHLKGGLGIANLEEWQGHDRGIRPETAALSTRLVKSDVVGWEFASAPPSVRQVRKWLRDEKTRLDSGQARKNSSQVIVLLLLGSIVSLTDRLD